MHLREQLFAQEKSLIQEQNHWLSAELENKSSEVLLVRKEKDVLQADLNGKIISRDQEVRVNVYLKSHSHLLTNFYFLGNFATVLSVNALLYEIAVYYQAT